MHSSMDRGMRPSGVGGVEKRATEAQTQSQCEEVRHSPGKMTDHRASEGEVLVQYLLRCFQSAAS